MAGIDDRIRRLEGGQPRPDDEARQSEARYLMREVLGEIAQARREGRPRAPWARAASEALQERRHG